MISLNVKDYPNVLNEIQHNTNWIKDQIKLNKLEFFNVHSDLAEQYSSRGKTFISVFYNYIISNDKIPSQNEFYDEVHKVYSDDDRYNKLQENSEFVDGFKARIYRAYPSLVRDLHLNKLFSELGYDVIYNIELDASRGIDTLLIIGGKYYGVGMFTNTQRARQKREEKMVRLERNNMKFDNVEYIDLAITKDYNCETVGGLWLYTQYHIEKLMENVK